MNALARVALAESAFTKGVTFSFSFSELKILLLVGISLLSALGIIYVNDCNRRLLITHDKIHLEIEELQIEKNKLLLERSSWGAQARVQLVAKNSLQMQIPQSSDIIMIKM